MLRKRSVDNKRGATFPAQALPWSGSTGMISAFLPLQEREKHPGNLKNNVSLAKETAKIQVKKTFLKYL